MNVLWNAAFSIFFMEFQEFISEENKSKVSTLMFAG
jgi:hypothetical protein